ncbi:MAG: glycosyltransferase [Verrucomicrobiaceae bacterium]|nr:glycosyltransferase [Verrucomicrobiaceae bacterium]
MICLDYGGPSVFVDDTCGWKVSAQTPAEAVEGLAAAILEFATEPLVRQKRATKARERVLQNHTWNQQGKKLREWICRVLAATEGAKL